jgi:chromosome segregation ATPase
MNNESSTESRSANGNAGVINPLLSGGLVIALLGNLILSGVLILKLGEFDETKRRAEEAEAGTARSRAAVSSLQVEVDSLTAQKNTLEPTIADWEKRLKEMADAEAALAAIKGKQRQAETDLAESAERLAEAHRKLSIAEKQKAETSSEVDTLKTEVQSLTKTKTDAKTMLAQAVEAEGRLSEARSTLVNTETRKKGLDADVLSAQASFDQLQKEANDARTAKTSLDTNAVMLRQQILSSKAELGALQIQITDLEAKQAAIQQEEEKLKKVQEQLVIAETRVSDAKEKNLRTQAESTQLAAGLEQLRKDVSEFEARREKAKIDFQKLDGDLAAAGKLLQVVSVKQGDLVRESARLEASIEKLKMEKDVLQKEIGQIEGQNERKPAPK